MTTQEYRYTRRGTTWKPCQGCGQEVNHLINEVCGDCARLIREGKLYREEQRRIKESGERESAAVPPSVFDFPGYYRGGHETTEAIRTAMAALTRALGTVRADRANAYVNLTNVQALLRPKTGVSGTRLQEQFFAPGMPAILRDLDQAILDGLEAAYQQGKHDGSSLLTMLAGGEITVAQFSERTINGKG